MGYILAGQDGGSFADSETTIAETINLIANTETSLDVDVEALRMGLHRVPLALVHRCLGVLEPVQHLRTKNGELNFVRVGPSPLCLNDSLVQVDKRILALQNRAMQLSLDELLIASDWMEREEIREHIERMVYIVPAFLGACDLENPKGHIFPYEERARVIGLLSHISSRVRLRGTPYEDFIARMGALLDPAFAP